MKGDLFKFYVNDRLQLNCNILYLWKLFFNFNFVLRCDDQCRKVHACAVANVDFDDFRMCATQARALSANQGERLRADLAGKVVTLLVMAMGTLKV